MNCHLSETQNHLPPFKGGKTLSRCTYELEWKKFSIYKQMKQQMLFALLSFIPWITHFLPSLFVNHEEEPSI